MVELLVAMSIMAIAVTAILGVLFSVQRGVETQMSISERQDRGRLVTQTLDREVRSAGSMSVSGDGQTLSILSLSNFAARLASPTGTCAQFKIFGGALYKRWWVPPMTAAATVPWNLVVTGVATTSGAFSLPNPANPVSGNTPSPSIAGKVLQVNMTLSGQRSANSQVLTETIMGMNVPIAPSNPCDGLPAGSDEQPSPDHP